MNIVIDNGTGILKSGFSGEDFPRVIVPNVIGYPKYDKIGVYKKDDNKECKIGQDALSSMGIMKLIYPLEHGQTMDWDGLEKIWKYTFDCLKVKLEDDNCVLLTEAPFNSIKNREKMVELMFEKFNVGALNIEIQAVLSLYASGRTSGLVLDSGDGVTHTVPVYEGYIVNNANLRTNLAGRDMTEELSRYLMQSGLYFTSSAEKEIVKNIKEKVCYISEDYDKELLDKSKIDYTLPDGQVIEIGQERFTCPEILFEPSLAGKEVPSHHTMVDMTIQNCPIDIRKELTNNIVLSGGTTMFKGYKKRLDEELTNIYNRPINVIAPLQRKFTVWLGGSILSSLDQYRQQYVLKKDYEEYGSSILCQKN